MSCHELPRALGHHHQANRLIGASAAGASPPPGGGSFEEVVDNGPQKTSLTGLEALYVTAKRE